MNEVAFARPVAVIRQRVAPTASANRVDLHELDGVPGFLVFSCAALHAEISPAACARNFANPRNEACITCPIGERFDGEAGVKNVPTQRIEYPASFDTIGAESDIEDRLRRRAAVRATGSQLAAHSCVRCERTARTAERLIGRLRLVRAHTLCVSCYNREREVLRGANAKGGRPIKWGYLTPSWMEIELDGQRRAIDIGLCSGEEEAQRLVARRWPAWKLIAYRQRPRNDDQRQTNETR